MKHKYFFLGFLFFAFFVLPLYAYAQSEPVMYFCKTYDEFDGEVDVSDRFTTGHLTVMVKSDDALNLETCSIQFDKWNGYGGKFEYYKKFTYTLEREMEYVFFTKNEDSDLSFDEPGFYRVFLLNDNGGTVASALIQIIEG
ncbi:MAG: hypothetical protein K8H86_12705 [Ignavibacteriaceae bacterium]|nr:hypothetical protein [Ignavibacteriaceae bacterium]